MGRGEAKQWGDQGGAWGCGGRRGESGGGRGGLVIGSYKSDLNSVFLCHFRWTSPKNTDVGGLTWRGSPWFAGLKSSVGWTLWRCLHFGALLFIKSTSLCER
jgi:hypothetical protein